MDRIEAERQRQPEDVFHERRQELAAADEAGDLAARTVVAQLADGDLLHVRQDEQWQVKQVGGTRWLTVGRVGSEEAFLLYDATGEPPEETVSNVKETLAKIRRSVGDEGDAIRVVLVGDPDDEDYAAHRAAIEADPQMQLVGEVDTRGKSESDVYDQTRRVAEQGHAQAAVRVRTRRGRDDERDERRAGDRHHRGAGLFGSPLPGPPASGFNGLDPTGFQQALLPVRHCCSTCPDHTHSN